MKKKNDYDDNGTSPPSCPLHFYFVSALFVQLLQLLWNKRPRGGCCCYQWCWWWSTGMLCIASQQCSWPRCGAAPLSTPFAHSRSWFTISHAVIRIDYFLRRRWHKVYLLHFCSVLAGSPLSLPGDILVSVSRHPSVRGQQNNLCNDARVMYSRIC